MGLANIMAYIGYNYMFTYLPILATCANLQHLMCCAVLNMQLGLGIVAYHPCQWVSGTVQQYCSLVSCTDG